MRIHRHCETCEAGRGNLIRPRQILVRGRCPHLPCRNTPRTGGRVSSFVKTRWIFSLIQVGDFTSYYLAVLNEVEPTPVEVIERLKKQLGEQRTISTEPPNSPFN